MPLTDCKECGEKVSELALFCPHCGAVQGTLNSAKFRANLSPPLFLTGEELRTLTGRVQRARQLEWLRENRIPHHTNAAGLPLVVRDQLIACQWGDWPVKGGTAGIAQFRERPKLHPISREVRKPRGGPK